MAVPSYEQIALNWQPDSSDNRFFSVIVVVVLALTLIAAIALSTIDVPEKKRVQAKVPDRVAQFIKKKPKPKKVVVPKPKLEPKPVPKPKPKVERKKDEPKKPLTQKEKTAREKAQNSGMLALVEEFSDLIDSSAVDAAVSTKVKAGGEAAQLKTAGLSADSIAASAGKGSGGVDSGRYAGGVGSTQLDTQDLALVKQSLFKEDVQIQDGDVSDKPRERGDNVRAEEEVIVVFDRNKGRLQSIYNRERRKVPGLQGKIVFEITVSPEGNVTQVRVVSSELNNPALERRLVARIKTFKFGAKAVEPVTVTFPVEFLPS